MSRAVAFLAVALVLAGACGAAEKKEPKPDPLVLSESVYWRQYFVSGMMRLSAEALKKEGDKWLPARLQQRMERDTRKLLAERGHDWEKTDWRDVAVWFQPRDIGEGALPYAPTVYPPDDWMQPEHDDSGWVRQRIAALPYQRTAQSFADMYNRMICLRTTFIVPDPGRVKALKLNMVYRGGVRVFVNGTEIARGHLPDGKIPPQTKGEDYPEEAYRAFLDEIPEPNKGRRCIPDLRLPFKDSPKPQGGGARMAPFRDGFRMLCNKKCWDRMTAIRDRKLGPVTIPGKLLRKGTNVLAVAIHGSHYHPIVVPGAGKQRFYSDNWAAHGAVSNLAWAHARLIELDLTDPSGAVPPVLKRPAGTQVWVEDMHVRCYPSDYNQPGSPAGTIRMVGGLNGTYSGQVVVGTTNELTDLKATCGELKRAGGGPPIPASAMRVGYMVPQPLNELYKLGYGRGFGCGPVNGMSVDTVMYISNNPLLRRGGRGELMQAEMAKISFFDHISADAPRSVPAGSSQPIWVSLAVPAGAGAGKYAGQVTVEAGGMTPTTVPVEVEVLNWRVPDALDFQSDVLFEPSPDGIAKHYKCRHWSREHFRLIDSSLKILHRAGNDVVYIPVLVNSEFGNRKDPTLIRWIRKTDGTLAFDYKNLDRYLDIVVKHLGKPAIISFGVMHNMMASPKPTVMVYDESKGRDVEVDMSWRTNPFDRIPMWKAFAFSLVDHMKERGLYESMFWGHAGDPENDPGLIYLLTQLFPDIYWTARTHSFRGGAGGGGHSREVFKAVSEIYAKGYTPDSRRGWLFRQVLAKEKWHNPLAPRQESSGTDLPYSYRLLIDRANHLGYTGMGGMGWDYFDMTWHDGYTGADWCAAGIPCFMIAWPGKKQVESGARFEAFVEGLQDAELRIFLEQAKHRNALPAALIEEGERAVIERFRGALCNRFRDSSLAINTWGWQERTRRVYDVSARAAAKIGLDVDFTEMSGKVPALGKRTLSLKIRNWTDRPGSWKAASSEPWLVPAKTEGTTAGQEDLAFTLDGTALKPGSELTGTLTVTDTGTGTSWPVKVAAEVTKPMELLFDHPHFNVTVGESETREFRVVNHAATPQPWELAASVPWIRIEPASGKLAPDKSILVRLSATPPDSQAAEHDFTFRFAGAAGAVGETIDAKTFVIPVYRHPGLLPFGRVIKLSLVKKKFVKRHKSLKVGDFVVHGRRPSGETTPRFGHEYRGAMPILGRKRFDRALWVMPTHETVYSLKGSGFIAFSAYVGIPVDVAKARIRQHERRVNFEIHVDGKVVAQSGMMTSRDRARLLAVEDLQGAGEVKLVTRLDSCGDNSTFLSTWANPQFYQNK